jgi:uncharacterized YccA/Bax inhibitor family protein
MTGNPTLNKNTFINVEPASGTGVMTIQGTVNKASILLVLLTVSAAYTWNLYLKGDIAQMTPWIYGGALVGFVFAIITSFKKEWSPVTAPIYAICEGLFVGGISSIVDAQFGARFHQSIVLQAVMLTLGTLAALLGCYKIGIIKATDNFKRGVFAATGGIALLYLVSMVLGFFHIQIPGIFGNGMIGIGFSIFVVIIAAMNLVIDFDFIEQGASVGAPKYMEWYAAFGLLVTLIWLYLEILRLLAKLNSRRD